MQVYNSLQQITTPAPHHSTELYTEFLTDGDSESEVCYLLVKAVYSGRWRLASEWWCWVVMKTLLSLFCYLLANHPDNTHTRYTTHTYHTYCRCTKMSD